MAKHLRFPILLLLSLLSACQATPESGAPSQPEVAVRREMTGIPPTITSTAQAGEAAATSTLTEQEVPGESESRSERPPNANVLFVEAHLNQGGTWTFAVTVEHEDLGWEDYADGWDVVLPDGSVVKPDPDSPFTRLLLHPHVDEQPFTRSQSGITIPPGIDVVTVRAHDLVDGFGGNEVVVDLNADEGPAFEVSR